MHMKNLYFIALLFVMATLNATAQGCLVDATLATSPGIFPPAPGYVDASRLIVMPNANVSAPYVQTAQIKVPVDTIVDTLGFQLLATIDSLKITRINNLPAGITYVCDNGNCTWIGGANGCVKLSGTPTVSNVYLAEIVAIGYATMPIIGNAVDTFYFNMHLFVDAPLTTEKLLVQAPTLFPNPTSKSVSINNLQNIKSDFSIEIYSLQGQKVGHYNFEKTNADNVVHLPLPHLSTGMYSYQIRAGLQNWTGRLQVIE